jgi:hypothetical protein
MSAPPESILHQLTRSCHAGIVLVVTRYHPEQQCTGIHHEGMVQTLVPHLEILVQRLVLRDAETGQLMTAVQVWPPLDLAHREPLQRKPVVACCVLRAAELQDRLDRVLADSLPGKALASDSIRLDPCPPSELWLSSQHSISHT